MAFTRWLVLSGLAVAAILAVGPCDRGPTAGGPVAVPSWAHVAPEQIAEAKKYGVPVAFENALGMRFVLIPSGTFLMGSPESETQGHPNPELWADERPQHEVQLTKPFYMGITEVTNGQYLHFEPGHQSGLVSPSDAALRAVLAGGRVELVSLNGETQPVGRVSWEEVRSFAAWLTARDAHREYRLPTEAEWEYACRAGTKTRFFWGESEAEGLKYANGCAPDADGGKRHEQGVWPGEDPHPVSAPAGSYLPNAWGLYDTAGNVWEWCEDVYAAYRSDRAADPRSPADGLYRVIRGGSWSAGLPTAVRPACRRARELNRTGDDLGFRLVSPLPPPR